MKKSKLFFQFYKAIAQATSFRTDKHSYKRSGCNKVKIFSYADRRNIIKCTNQLCKYLESEYVDIELIKNINAEHINSFLNYKSQFCTNETIKNYKYCITKLEKMLNQYLYLKVKYIDKNTNIKAEVLNIRNIKMEEEDIEILLNEINKTNSKVKLGVKIAICFGLRSEEVCKLKGKDINIKTGVLHVHEGKGKRSRDISIVNKEQWLLCKEIKEKIEDNSRVCPVQPNSLNAAIRRILIRNNITRYAKSETGVHAIRKYYATKDYNSNIKELENEKVAWDLTANRLGHGKGRDSLKNVYVKV